MRYGTYASFTRRKLFPPVVPTSIPAFDGEKQFKIFFKKSAANFATGSGQAVDFRHVQVSIRKVSNNANALDTSKNKYKTGYIIAELSHRALDEPGIEPKSGVVYKVYGRDDKSPYCLFLDGKEEAFQELNTLYKVQLRLGEQEYSDSWTVADLQEMNRNGTISEWSTVMAMKPIERPDFGIYKFNAFDTPEGKEGNKIATANFQYVGYYESNFIRYDDSGNPIFTTVNEKLSEYWFKLYSSQNKLLSESGSIVTIEHDRPNISHTFNYLTQDRTNYYVVFGIKTENGYIEEKKYLVTGDYKVLEMSNAMVRVTEERDRARMKIEVQAKQVVLEPIIKQGSETEMSKLGFVRDETDPQYDVDLYDQSRLISTHAVIEGSVETSKSFYLSCPNDKWVMEAKVSGIVAHNSREEALSKPYIVVENDFSLEKDVMYYTRMKVICYKEEEFDFGVDVKKVITDERGIKHFAKTNTEPTYKYYIEAVKTSYKKSSGIETEIAAQATKTRSVIKKKFSTERPILEPVTDVDGQLLTGTVSTEGSLNRYIHKESRHTLTTNPNEQLLDIKYFDDKNPSQNIINTSSLIDKRAFISNENVPFNPLKESYLFISNNLGSMVMYLFDEGYTTGDAEFIKYLQTKTLLPSMELEQLSKY